MAPAGDAGLAAAAKNAAMLFRIASLLLCAPLAAFAQIDCIAPREDQDSVREARYAPQLKTLLAIEAVIRANSAFMSPPEPVRLRTTVAAGPFDPSGARLFVRAYPEKSTVGIRVWTAGCGVIPQAERIAASIGQIDVFVNHSVQEMFLQTGVPRYEGQVGGYPRYNGWVVITKDGRLPWIPQTLADRLDREGEKRDKALAEWRQQMATLRAPDPAVVDKTYRMFQGSDPAGAERYKASMQQLALDVQQKQQTTYPALTAQFEKEVADLRRYRATFSAAELQQPAVWADVDGAAKRALDERIRQLQTPRSTIEQRAPQIRDAQAQYDLLNLRPGPGDRAIAFKPDPALPDLKDPTRVQLIALLFSEDPRKQRGPWMKATQDRFDFAALAALIR